MKACATTVIGLGDFRGDWEEGVHHLQSGEIKILILVIGCDGI